MKVSKARVTKLTVRAKPMNNKNVTNSLGMGLTGVAKYDRNGDNNNGAGAESQSYGEGLFDDDGISPQGWGSGGNSPSNNNATQQQIHQKMIDPYASSDDDE